ncbi:MAG: NAD-dependent epimerase/dehydratase family protein [Nitrospirota bacterium]
MKHVLVTGAGGFVGDHLANQLRERGCSVRMLIHRRPDRCAEVNGELVYGDIRDARIVRLATAGADTVIHLASKVHDLKELKDGGEHDDVTVGGTRGLMAAVRSEGTKSFVFLSSLSVYGTDTDCRRDEEATCVPTSAYGRAKLRAEGIVFEEGRKIGIHICCLRPAMIYGPGCKGNLPRMIEMIDRGFFPPLPEVKNRRSMVHVSDVVEAAILAATHPAANGQCYIVTDGRSYSARELYEMICRALGKSIRRWHVPLGAFKALAGAGDVIGRLRGRRFVFDSDALDKLTGNAWFSSEKISRELGYRPRMTFEDALPEMIAWYRGTQARPTC